MVKAMTDVLSTLELPLLERLRSQLRSLSPAERRVAAWHSCGDLDPELAQNTREALWAELEKPNTWGVGSHFPHLIPGSVLIADSRRWAAATPADPITTQQH